MKTGAMGLGAVIGAVDATSVQRQALVAKIAELNDHLVTAQEEGDQEKINSLTQQIEKANQKMTEMTSAPPGDAPAMDTTSFAEGGFVNGAMQAIVGDVTGGEIIMPLEKAADFMIGPLQEAISSIGNKVSSAGTSAASALKPTINLTVVLEGRELRAFVKEIVTDTLNPFK
jgi:uncharacterized coiled-coil protein SlyX